MGGKPVTDSEALVNFGHYFQQNYAPAEKVTRDLATDTISIDWCYLNRLIN
jgi:hypothetical protein